MAGESQIVINNQGITITTNEKIIFKAGQHKFEKAVESTGQVYRASQTEDTEYTLKSLLSYQASSPKNITKICDRKGDYVGSII